MEKLNLRNRAISVLALGILLVLGIWNATSDHWEPPQSGVINAAKVDTILTYSTNYENFTVSFVSWIRAIETTANTTTLTFVGVKGVLSAVSNSPLEGYEPGDNVAIKGISYIVSRGYILVDAIHPINHQVIVGLSILGGGIFVYYFFGTYTLGPGLSLRRRV
jgi:hypothetical protein